MNRGTPVFQHGYPPGAAQLPSVTPLHAEIKAVLRTVVQAIQSQGLVQKVILNEGQMGAPTTVCVSIQEEATWRANSAKPLILQAAKDKLLWGAQCSSNTYVMGYEVTPFTDDPAGGFDALLGSVPPSMEGIACWETYRRGTCARHGQCALYHPCARDLAPVRVVFSNR